MYAETKVNKVNVDLYSALSRNSLASKALRYDTCYTRDHTVLPATKHEPYLPLLPSRRASLPLAGTHCAYPRRGGQAELTWGLVRPRQIFCTGS